ncbi:MAG: phosphatase PAP2 family protein [Bacteroidetes bacterium]|nr:MAG: phosphatase PAP2 family protein [Bacteroidota bacterium]
MLEFLMQLDRDLFLFFNGLHAPWLDPVMYYISEKFFWIPLYVLLLWFCKKHYGWQTLMILIMVALLITITDQLTGLMKDFFQRFRPSRDENLADLVHIVYGKRGGRFGFVSAHAANSFALAVFMIHLLRGKIKYIAPVLLTWATMKTYSRMYLGVHYPGDLIGGAIVGILSALIIIELWKVVQKRIYPAPLNKFEPPGKAQ